MPRDAWIALAVAAASAVSLWELARTPGTGPFVKTTTFPNAVCTVLLALALVHFAGAWLGRARAAAAPGAGVGPGRAAGRVGVTVRDIAGLPGLG
jgi:hypothetical protein